MYIQYYGTFSLLEPVFSTYLSFILIQNNKSTYVLYVKIKEWKSNFKKREFREKKIGDKLEAWTFDFFPFHCLITHIRTTVRRKSNLPQQKLIFFLLIYINVWCLEQS